MRKQKTLPPCRKPTLSIAKKATALMVTLFPTLRTPMTLLIKVDMPTLISRCGLSATPGTPPAQKLARALITAATMVGCRLSLRKPKPVLNTLCPVKLVKLLTLPAAKLYTGMPCK